MMEVFSGNDHPLEKICNWVEERQPPEINVAELYTNGPDVAEVTESEFRGWINEGIHLQVLSIKSLASVIQRNLDNTLPSHLPEIPPIRSGY